MSLVFSGGLPVVRLSFDGTMERWEGGAPGGHQAVLPRVVLVVSGDALICEPDKTISVQATAEILQGCEVRADALLIPTQAHLTPRPNSGRLRPLPDPAERLPL